MFEFVQSEAGVVPEAGFTHVTGIGHLPCVHPLVAAQVWVVGIRLVALRTGIQALSWNGVIE